MSVIINARVSERLSAAVKKAVELRSATYGNGTSFRWTVSLYIEEALRSALRKDGVGIEVAEKLDQFFGQPLNGGEADFYDPTDPTGEGQGKGAGK